MTTDVTTAKNVNDVVNCTSCVAVCCRLTVVLMPEDDVPHWLIHNDERGLRTLLKGADGRCAAVDPVSFGCTIYEDRPGICRKFTMGGPSCREERLHWVQKGHFLPTSVVTSG